MGPNRPHPGYRPFVDHPGHPWFWLLVVVAVAAATVLIVWLIVRRRPVPSSGSAPYGAPPAPYGTTVAPHADPALEQARLRYARGEVSREEYLRIVADLGGTPPPAAPAGAPPPGAPPAPQG